MDIDGETDTMSGRIVKLPYRWVYAVMTQDSILIYDTESSYPRAIVANLHYATLTDAAWSMDGCTLLITSTDGFCSVVSFESGELGVPAPHLVAFLTNDIHSSSGAAVTSAKSVTSDATITLASSLIKRKTAPAPANSADATVRTGPGGLVGSDAKACVDAMDVDGPVRGVEVEAFIGESVELKVEAVKVENMELEPIKVEEDTKEATNVPETKKRRIAPTFISSA
ncbi:hypothetical protein HK097_003363 [Rhizophlyctis rosea]|uniref:CAF1B/HIR1 beta-propeller domain-containing protein n=1 Tax=Rhizophlyctis rosea TaxID=64517 RepID=A0AAD5X3V1_9FUNG|nr:hypothetical protein HK097_003363 [Rhizophlyctis rosea]